MKNHSKLLLIALIIVLIAPACKKYEEGPAISFRSKKARLANQWKIQKVLRDAIDITANYNENHVGLVVEFLEGGEYSASYKDQSGDQINIAGTWAFNKGKTAVNITESSVTTPNTILCLKNDELWLKTTIGSTITEYHYITN